MAKLKQLSDLHEQGQSSTQHLLLNHTCEIDGDVAHAESYYLFVGRNRDETNWIAGGRYIDRLERRGGTWKIALRCNAVEWSGMIPTMAVPFANVPGVHQNGMSSSSPTRKTLPCSSATPPVSAIAAPS